MKSINLKRERNMKNFKLMATMGAGMESLVARELKEMGYATETENGRVFF